MTDFISEVIAEDAKRRQIPRPYQGCPLLQAAKDKKLRAALIAEFNDQAIADRVMRVIKEQRV